MEIRVPERNRKAGLSYAVTDDGLELPVIDVDHPAFSVDPTEAEIAALRASALEQARRWKRAPRPVRWFLTHAVLGQGALTRAIVGSRGSFLGGMATYLLKLGPENLGSGYAKRIDRVVAGTLPCLSVRLRLQHMARLLADGLHAGLDREPGRPLILVNIGGGAAADSFNALLLLRRRSPDRLAGRRIRIRVLDLDAAGPSFGARAVEALLRPGAPLAGLDLAVEHVRYDWRDAGRLGAAMGGDGEPLVACSSEGALFEYGSDEEIVANLAELRRRAPAGTFVAGSVTRVDAELRELHETSGAALRLRGLPAFEALAGRAGWRVTSALDAPLTHDVRLEVEAGAGAR